MLEQGEQSQWLKDVGGRYAVLQETVERAIEHLADNNGDIKVPNMLARKDTGKLAHT
jgi:hypothetical protein